MSNLILHYFNYWIQKWKIIIFYIFCIFSSIISIGKSLPLHDSDSNIISKQKIYYFQDSTAIKKTDIKVLNSISLFKNNNSLNETNVVTNSNTVMWLKFQFDAPLHRDYVVQCNPYYKHITFYYYTSDSVLVKKELGTDVHFSRWQYFNHLPSFDLPQQSLNKYYIKYEFYDTYLVAGYWIVSYTEFFNSNLLELLTYVSLTSFIFLIVIFSIIYYIINKEVQNLYYGLYGLFFAIYIGSHFYIWHFISDYIMIQHSHYVYYIPFSLSTCFFALYVLKSIEYKLSGYLINIFYGILIFKAATALLPLFNVRYDFLMDNYFVKLDQIIFAFLTYLAVKNILFNHNLSNWWLGIGVFTLFISQMLHTIFPESTSIFFFMGFDIFWFGIGLAIRHKVNKEEKIKALNDIIHYKNTYSSELEIKVEERTKQLTENGLQLKDKLNTIATLNAVLKENNISLIKNVENLEHNRILNKKISFEEFKAEFANLELCINLLSELKWKNGYVCDSCGNTQYINVKNALRDDRKCSKCGIVRSASANTLFHNIKFPLEKAFYILFLCTSGKKYSIDQMSEIVSMRTATVWSFKKKVEDKMEVMKFYKNKDMTWQDLIL